MKQWIALAVLLALLIIPVTGGILAARASWRGKIGPGITAILVGFSIFLGLSNTIHHAGLGALWLLGEQ